jgi:hypothetical protein
VLKRKHERNGNRAYVCEFEKCLAQSFNLSIPSKLVGQSKNVCQVLLASPSPTTLKQGVHNPKNLTNIRDQVWL